MKCRDCNRLFVGTDENKKEVYVCLPVGKVVDDIDWEFEECVIITSSPEDAHVGQEEI